MLDDINEHIFVVVLGRPGGDALHIVARQDGVGMVAEAGDDGVELARVSGIHAQFVNVAHAVQDSAMGGREPR